MRNVTIRQLQIFVEAAKSGSFARVAERLHVSPAAVSFQIKQIESMIGFPLFERIGKKAMLTNAGETLLDYARIMLDALQQADHSLSGLKGVGGGRVRVGLVSTAKYFVPHMMARFKAEHPGVIIHLRDGNREEIAAALEHGEIDLAITGRPRDETEIVAQRFAAHPSVIIAAPDHPLAQREQILPQMLVGEQFIMREDGSGTRMLVEQFFRALDCTLSVGMTTSSNETTKQSVMAGMGIALISRHTIGLEHALGLIRILPVEGFPLMRSWFVAQRRGMPVLPVQAGMREFLLRHGQSIIEDLERNYARIGQATGRI